MAIILYLRLDETNDPVFDPNAVLEDLDAVTQAIDTRLKLLQGEWWENLNEGLPLFQQILGVSRKKGSQDLASLSIIARIKGTPFVSSVVNVNSSLDATRKLNFSAVAQTSFGSVPVVFNPGSSASLGA